MIKIYDNYFQVPDGALCRPQETYGFGFALKQRWMDHIENSALLPAPVALGKWETEEKTISLTEAEFEKAINRAGARSGGDIFTRIKQELFK